MKTAITILALVCHAVYINAQVTFNLQGGWAARQGTKTSTLTYQAGLRYQPSDIGFKASFNQTDGINHTFDSYTLSGTYQPADLLYFTLGYRFDNGRGWGDNSHNVNLGINAMIPVQDNADLIFSIDHTTNGITNLMFGVQLDFNLKRNGKTRFF